MWSNEMIEELKIYYIDSSKEFLEKKFNKNFDTIRKKANSLKIKRKQKFIGSIKKDIDLEYIKFLNNNDNKKSLKEISNILNISKETIRKRLNDINYKIIIHEYTRGYKKYKEDSDYFTIIDSEEKAYFLGFIFADGCITKSKRNAIVYSTSLNIHIHKKDIEILDLFKKSIKYTGEIKTKDNHSIIRIFNKKIVEDIEKIGCVERKSLILKFPKIESIYLHHFMRGYFDGDGSVRYAKNIIRRCSVGITSSHIFVEKYMELLSENCGINIVKLSKNTNYSSVNYSGRGNATKIFNFLYKDATIYLKRKYNKFQEIIYKEKED